MSWQEVIQKFMREYDESRRALPRNAIRPPRAYVTQPICHEPFVVAILDERQPIEWRTLH